MGFTAQQICGAKDLRVGTPEYQQCILEMGRKTPDELQKIGQDAGLQQPGPGVAMEDYPYTVPFMSPNPSRVGKIVTNSGHLAPVRLSDKYGFPRPSELPQVLTVDEAKKVCRFNDACPITDGSSVKDAEGCAASCKFAADYGCPVYFIERNPAMKFAELKGIEIFNAGTHKGKTFTDEDIVKIADNFQKFGQKVQPPMVLGHGDEDEQFILNNSGLPAAGWITALRVEDRGGRKTLVADFGDVPDAIVAAIQKKAYKRISSEIYPNFMDEGTAHGMMIRRVALLGADVPEVKDLADVVALSDIEDPIFAFSEEGSIMPNRPATDPSVSALQRQLAEEKKKREELSREFVEMKITKDRENIVAFCDSLKTKGQFLPKWEEQGVIKFIESLDDTATMKFAEDAEDAEAVKVSPRQFFRDFLLSLPNVVDMTETAAGGPGTVPGTSGSDKNADLAAAADKLVAEAAKENKVLKYAEAVNLAALKNPSLVQA